MPDQVRVTRSRLVDGTEAVAVRGDIDGLTAGVLLGELLDECADAATHVALDVSALDFIDSAGLGVLLKGHRRLEEADRHLVLVAPTASFVRLLQITGLDGLLRTAPSADRALEDLSRGEPGPGRS